MDTLTVKDLSEGMGFFLPNTDFQGTNANSLYTVVKVCEDGIYATGKVLSLSGTLFNSFFWLPNFTQAEEMIDVMSFLAD